MSNDNYVPMPEGYAALEISSISNVAYVPDKSQAVIWCESTQGQKVALVCDMAALNRAVIQLQNDPLQTRARARART